VEEEKLPKKCLTAYLQEEEVEEKEGKEKADEEEEIKKKRDTCVQMENIIYE
jgi:hypothetical protein